MLSPQSTLVLGLHVEGSAAKSLKYAVHCNAVALLLSCVQASVVLALASAYHAPGLLDPAATGVDVATAFGAVIAGYLLAKTPHSGLRVAMFAFSCATAVFTAYCAERVWANV